VPDLLVIDSVPASADLIERIEEVLEKANAGELSSVAIACVYRDGATGQSWSAPPSFGTLLGSVARLAHKMNAEMDE
jgi:hypothetical protein